LQKGLIMNKFGRFQHLVGLCAAAAAAVSLATAAPQTGSAKVTSVKGNVTLGGQPARVGSVGGPGSVIVTGAAAEVVLDLGVNGPVARVLELSSVSIDDLTYDTLGSEPVISTKFTVSRGKLEGNVKKTSSQSSYIVKTPTATAAIRGTTFSVWEDGTVYVWEGVVDVTYRDPRTGREVTYTVSAAQLFEPSSAEIRDIPAGAIPPTLDQATGPATVTPAAGPVIFVSPTRGD
jgi:hypothetical protein